MATYFGIAKATASNVSSSVPTVTYSSVVLASCEGVYREVSEPVLLSASLLCHSKQWESIGTVATEVLFIGLEESGAFLNCKRPIISKRGMSLRIAATDGCMRIRMHFECIRILFVFQTLIIISLSGEEYDVVRW